MRKPNIVLILADDMGYGDLDVQLDGGWALSALTELAAEGVTLTQHYSGAPVCAPARAALLTGRYPHRTGAVDTLETLGADRLGRGERTLADHLHAAGYTCGLVGKWHLGAYADDYHPLARGFQEFVGFRGGWSDYYHWHLECGGRRQEGDGRYLTDVFTAAARDFVRRQRAVPFFLHLAYNAPHFPLQAPEADIAPFRMSGRTEALATLYGMLRAMDRGIASLMADLQALGLARDTIVVFASDNGPDFGGQGPRSTARPNGGLRGQKGLTFEGGIRVPAIVRWPSGLPAATTVTDLIHFCDWAPTLLAAAGVRPLDGPLADGVSQLTALAGSPPPSSPDRFWQWNRYRPTVTSNAAMRSGPWKLVRPAIAESMRLRPEDAAADRRAKAEPDWVPEIPAHLPEVPLPPPPPPMLFNLAADPGEARDLAAAEPARRAAMLTALEGWFADVTARAGGRP